jgi:O-antigen/teichoic acid export membrane protein
MLINIAINLVFIPRLGVVGAASAALFGNFLIFAVGYYFIPKITQISHSYLLKIAMLVAVSSGVMGLAVWYIDKMTNFIVAILVGAVVYTGTVFLTGAIKKSDWSQLLLMIKR